MKRLLAIGMILFSHSAYAEWVKLAESTGTIVFVDPSTKKGGLMPRVWILLDYSKPETSGESTVRSLYEADCKDGRLRGLASAYYSDSGRVLHTDSSPEKWDYLVPGSLKERIYVYLCGKAP